MAVVDRVGVTARLEVDYIRPVPTGAPLDVVTWIDSIEARKIYTTSELRRDDEPLARAKGLFSPLRRGPRGGVRPGQRV
jgi:acyl-CoA thioesterase FadM